MPEIASKSFLASTPDLQEDAASTALASSQEDSEGDSQKANPQKIIWADVSDSDDEEETPAGRKEVHDDGWTTVDSRTKPPKQAAARPTVAPGRSWASVVSEAKRPSRDVDQNSSLAQDNSKWRKERQHRGWHDSSGSTSRPKATEYQSKAMNRGKEEQQKKKTSCEETWKEHRRQPRSADHKGYWQDQQGKHSNHVRKGGDWQEQRKQSEKPASTEDWLSKRMGAAAA